MASELGKRIADIRKAIAFRNREMESLRGVEEALAAALEVEGIKTEMANLQKELETEKQRVAEEMTRINDRLVRENQTKVRELDNLLSEKRSSGEADLKSLSDKSLRAATAVKEMKTALQELTDQIGVMKGQRTELQAEIDSLRSQLGKIQSGIRVAGNLQA